jgi:hypothetical protein
MIVRICRHCRTRFSGQRCPCRPPKRGVDTAARKAQHNFRAALLAASDGRCSYTDPSGARCAETENLAAAHASPYAADGNMAAGGLLCSAHHTLIDHGVRRAFD